MSRQSELAELSRVYDSSALSNRNVIINGAMQVSQRKTSFANVGNVYTLDRFEFYKQNSGAAFTVTQSSVTDLAGFANALKVDCTTADTSLASNEQAYISYKAEGQDLQRFQKGHATALGFTLSFYVKTNKAGVYTVSMFDRDNTRKVNGSYTVADANWNRYTINFPADTTGKFDDDNASSLEIFFNLYAGSDTNTGTLSETWAASADAGSTTGQVNFADNTSNDWEITGIQLEVGDTVTDFEHRSYGDQLQRCQRYFHSVTVGADNTPVAVGAYYTATSVYATVFFPVTMRSNPSLTSSNTSGHFHIFRNGNVDAIDGWSGLQSAGLSQTTFYISSGPNSTTGSACWVETNDAAAVTQFDAEL